MKQHPVRLVQSMEKNRDRVKTVLQEACSHINTFYEVDDLCNSFPERLKLLFEKQGEKLKY